MVKPDVNDVLKIRRALALVSAVYALFVWPHLLIFYHLCFGLPETTLPELLTYVGVIASGPIGAYLWAAMKKQNNHSCGGD